MDDAMTRESAVLAERRFYWLAFYEANSPHLIAVAYDLRKSLPAAACVMYTMIGVYRASTTYGMLQQA